MAELGEPRADPGWRPAWQAGPALILPQFAMRRARNQRDLVVALRSVFLSFCLLVVVVGVLGVFLLVAGGDATTPVSPLGATLGVAAIAGMALFAQWRTGTRTIAGDDTLTVVASYYKRFLRRCALAAIILPWAILGGLFSLSVVPLAVGMGLCALSLNLMAPTRDRLLADRATIAEQGSPVDLIEALSTRGASGGPQPKPTSDGRDAPRPSRRTGGAPKKKRKKR
ncbi:MAG: hypothetical protein JJU45_11240 [Acidimicrobiia bacterium]|nr:hypothetical protein [Acidimicrobiia bacterium]